MTSRDEREEGNGNVPIMHVCESAGLLIEHRQRGTWAHIYTGVWYSTVICKREGAGGLVYGWRLACGCTGVYAPSSLILPPAVSFRD